MPKIHVATAEDCLREWWYSRDRAEAQTSKEIAAGIQKTLASYGYEIVKASVSTSLDGSKKP